MNYKTQIETIISTSKNKYIKLKQAKSRVEYINQIIEDVINE